MVLELSNISKKYGKKEILHSVNAKLETGVYGLLGPNGAGKSTLMNIITGLLKQSGGTVLFNGEDIDSLGRDYRKVLGYLPQNPGLYPFYTGRQLMEYFAKLKNIDNADEKIKELLELVHLTDDAEKKVGVYSGGMKKRIGIAVALLNQPQLLVMDEPTAGLDPKERIRFRSILSKIKHESIIIVCTHIVSDVEHIADNIIMMEHGDIVAADKCNVLINSIKDKIWYMKVDNKDVLRYSGQFRIVNAMNTDVDHTGLRFIADERPFEAAEAVYPNLEDVYMYYFGSDD